MTVLTGTGLHKRYGNLHVLDDVGFTASAGEAIGIVGPNGAGKTTLLNVLAGSVTPDSGTVRIGDDDVTRSGPQIRCRKGIGRAHQIPRPFGGMTVLENVLVGATYGAGLRGRAAQQHSIGVLRRCELLDLADRRAETLGLLHRKRLEMARAVATEPRVLLLDEIGAGLTDAEAAELVTTIRDLVAAGITVVWIEHIVHVLLQVVDRLICMDAGKVIADGEPTAVLRDAVVVDAYLGRER